MAVTVGPWQRHNRGFFFLGGQRASTRCIGRATRVLPRGRRVSGARRAGGSGGEGRAGGEGVSASSFRPGPF